ncbi:MAG TPA: cupredoxin domain-containing protein [Gaiellaceae bacterium]|nr:cupredoxin domain-containing protein [Gaiellaceae bacterium]
MRKSLLVATVVAAALGAAPHATAATVQVRITSGGFAPSTVTIQTGDRVTWTNRDTRNHQVVSTTGAFASPILRPGQSYSFTFRAAGTYRYRDALFPDRRGTIRVQGPPPSVTLGLSEPIVRHGDESRLQGSVSTRRAGETVTLWAQPYGQASFVQLAVATTVADGVFDVVVKPGLLTHYYAEFRGVRSEPIFVQVRPRITLLPGRRGWFLTRVTGDRSYAGKWVYLQRRNQFAQWVSISRLALGPNSGRLFRIPATAGTYRIYMTVNQAGVGYLDSWSGTQRVGGR